MRKKKSVKGAVLLVLLLCFPLLGGCGDAAQAPKLQDLEFTVVAEEEIPQALAEVIEEKKASPFQISYNMEEVLYLAVGYGEQMSSGYCITVNELYETEESICLDTTLTGPKEQEEILEVLTYPYIVIKTEAIADKKVDFQ